MEGDVLASGGADNTVRVWNTKKMRKKVMEKDKEKDKDKGNGKDKEKEKHEAESKDGNENGKNGTTVEDCKLVLKRIEEIGPTYSSDLQLSALSAKATPVYKVLFSPRNLLLAVGPSKEC
jgi:WD40 repeat protein